MIDSHAKPKVISWGPLMSCHINRIANK